MVEFCPECDSLLRRKVVDGKQYLECKCGYKESTDSNDDEIQKEIEKKKQALDENLIVVSDEDKISVHPIVTRDCPKCDCTEAEAWQEQTRSADEPSTSFFRCVKCRFTWREY